MKTPVLMIIFNRPDTTKVVFDAVRKARPEQLFIASDGPRPTVEGEARLCKMTQELCMNVDWPCEVKTLFRTENLGVRHAVSSAVDWFFSEAEEGIIFEGDCVPDQTFFPFCEELLDKYRDDTRVMHIGGTNVEFYNETFHTNDSYYFLTAPCIWGWATWRRAWQKYDVDLKRWPEIRDAKQLYTLVPDSVAFRLGKKFQGYYDGITQSWDGQWLFACITNNGLSIYPSHNLISNIGFDENATYTKISDPLWDSLPLQPLSFPLTHPTNVGVDVHADRYNFAVSYNIDKHWQDRVKWFFKSRFQAQYFFIKDLYYKTIKPAKYASHVQQNDSLFMK